MSIKHLYLVGAAAVLACASSGNYEAGATHRNSSVLSGDEIAAAHTEFTNAYDIVARLRPNWLAAHGVISSATAGPGTEYAVVYLDGQRYGDLTSLRNIIGFHVKSVHYYNVSEAGARYGFKGGGAGVIDVDTNLPGK